MSDDFFERPHRSQRLRGRGGVGALPIGFERRECEPTTIMLVASLAISAASAVSQVQGQKYAAEAQAEQQQNLVKANNSVAEEQMSQLRIQEAQQQESATRESEKARLAAQKSRASAIVSAGEAGITGNSVDAMLGEYGMQLGQFREAVARQTQLNTQSTGAQIDAIRTGTRFQNLQINAPITGPNYAGAALQFAGDAMGAYRAYNPSAFQKPKTPVKTT